MLSRTEKIAYGLGDTASNIIFQTVMLFLAFFYTDIFIPSAAAAGSMFPLCDLSMPSPTHSWVYLLTRHARITVSSALT